MNNYLLSYNWYNILHSLGIRVSDDPMKHTACPVCGKGKNGHRFRFDDKDGRGTWICNQCGAGDGFILIQNYFGITFQEAATMVEGVTGQKLVDKQDDKENIKKMLNRIYKKSMPVKINCPVNRYLASRHINHVGVKHLMYCPDCYNSETKRGEQAMIGIVTDRSGKAISLHRTYLKSKTKKLTTGIRSIHGCTIKLYGCGNVLGIAEGIETAMSARQIFSVPVWAAISSKVMENFIPPDHVEKLIIFADNDKNFTGQAAAYKLAHNVSMKKNVKIEIKIPEITGDWNDVLIQKRRS